jgi:hypothetical protein
VPDRVPLALVGVQEPVRRPALRRRGELPAEVGGVLQAGVHALATGLVSFRIGHPERTPGLSPRRSLTDMVTR